jgi:peptidoglycan/LPS O-acetylase OafA/YrhL
MTSATPTTAIPLNGAQNKLLGLELVRFVCALAVLVFHYQHFWFKGQAAQGLVMDDMPGYAWLPLRVMYRFGYLGVEVFWCISGFIFFWKYRDAIADGAVSGYKFFVLRASRLYPLHFVTLLLVAVLQLAYFQQHQFHFVYGNHDLPAFLSHLFMASNWLPSQGWSFNGPIWSVSLEVLVYIVFFCAARFIGRGAWLAAAILGVCVALRLAGVDNSLLRCLAFFYAGGLVAVLAERLDALGWRARGMLAAALWVAVVGAVSFQMQIHKAPWFKWEYFLLLYVPALLYVASADVKLGPVLTRWIETLGNMTYSSYLLHFPVQLAIAVIFAALGLSMPMLSGWFLVLYLGVVLGLAPLVYRHFELPMQQAIRRWAAGRR